MALLPVTADESKNRNEAIYYAEDAKEQDGRMLTHETANDGDNPREQVHRIVSGIHVKNAEQVLIGSGRGDEPENSHHRKYRAKKKCQRFSHNSSYTTSSRRRILSRVVTPPTLVHALERWGPGNQF